MKKLLLSAALLSLALPLAALAETRYRSVDFPGAANTALYALNDLDHLVGAEKDAAGAHHAIVDRGQGLTLLDPDGPVGRAAQSWAYSINRRDDVAGAYIDAAGASHGYVCHADGRVETIDMPGGFDTQAYGVNDRGDLIGLFNDAAGMTHAFVRRAGQYRSADLAGAISTTPLSINDAGQIAGDYVATPDTTGYGYIAQPDGTFTLYSVPGAPPESTYFISINNAHAVLGTWIDADFNPHNFVRDHGRDRPFDLPARFGATAVWAQTLNDPGDIVGYYFDAGGVAHGFLATRGR